MFEYQTERRRALRRTALSFSDAASAPPKGTVVTLLEPGLRSLVTLATDEVFISVHTDNPEAARRALEDRKALAVLVSPGTLAGEPVRGLKSLLARQPSVFPIAVVNRLGVSVGEGVLDLGRCGVTRMIDLASADGCSNLRAAVEENGGHAHTRRRSAPPVPEAQGELTAHTISD